MGGPLLISKPLPMSFCVCNILYLDLFFKSHSLIFQFFKNSFMLHALFCARMQPHLRALQVGLQVGCSVS